MIKRRTDKNPSQKDGKRRILHINDDTMESGSDVSSRRSLTSNSGVENRQGSQGTENDDDTECLPDRNVTLGENSPCESPTSMFKIGNTSLSSAPLGEVKETGKETKKDGFLKKAVLRVKNTLTTTKNRAVRIEKDTDEAFRKAEAKQGSPFVMVAAALEQGPPIAVLDIEILQGRNMQATRRPCVSVDVEGKIRTTETKTGSDPVWNEDGSSFNFGLTDPTGDIRITLYDSENKVGRVIIPIRWLYVIDFKRLSVSWNPIETWLKILPMPLKETLKDTVAQKFAGVRAQGVLESEEKKFLPALRTDEGTGLPNQKLNLGHLKIKVSVREANLTNLRTFSVIKSIVMSYIRPQRSGAPVVRWREIAKGIPEFLNDEENDKVLHFEGVVRLIDRIKALVKGPPLILRPPFSIGTIVWLYIASFKVSSPQVPWMMLSLILLEGLSLWIDRDISQTLMWESQVEKKEKKGILELGGILKKNLLVIGVLQHKIHLLVTTIERIKNVISFGDSVGSIIFYIFVATLALLAQYIISILPPGLPWFLVGVAALIPPYIKLYKYYFGYDKAKQKNVPLSD